MSVAPDDTLIDSYRTLQARKLVFLVLAALALVGVAILDMATGPAMLPLGDVWSVITRPSAHAGTVLYTIVMDIRLPMTLTAMTVGASLGLAGAEMQTILRNPLASPYTLGLSAAAGFGASLAILTGLSLPFLPWLGVPVAAFCMALIAALVVYAIGRSRGVTTDILVLTGIAMLFLFQSLQSLMQYLASPDVLQVIVFWLFGSLAKASWTTFWITATVYVAVVPLILRGAWRLTALSLGDQTAQSLGIKVGQVRLRMLILISVLTASAVSFTGTIGFVGLVAPHLARGLVGEDQRYLVPLSSVFGAFILGGASVLSKSINPGAIIPIGIVTAVIGVPFLLLLIHRKKKV
ncbi:MAG: FecCD family ABC transporter permease [Qingshengfaniella sp.]